MNCPRCKRRLRPLKKKDKLGRSVKEMPGVHYCKICNLQVINKTEVLKHRAEQKRFVPGLEPELEEEELPPAS